MKRSVITCVLAVICASLMSACDRPGSTPGGQHTRSRPNVVMIIMDTLRADKLGCYGFHENTSPELDEMAKRGVLFKDVVSQCSWTRPSIGSMLTSLYPRTLGLYKEKNQILADQFVTLAEILHDHGFKTIGTTANPNINSVFNFHQGFDTYIDSNVVWHWMNVDKGEVTERQRHLPSAKELFANLLELAASSEDRPHYIQVNVMEMHEYLKKGDRSLIRPEFARQFPHARNRKYLQSLRQLSTDIDRFVEALASLPGWSNTLFVLTSDHGEGLDDHPDVWKANSHGWVLYESNVKVPLIFYNPAGGLPARTITDRVRLLDMMPTILDYLGIPVPDSVEGLSLMPLVRGETDRLPLPEYFVTETQFRINDKIAVYSPEWKYGENRDVDYITRKERDQGVNSLELQLVGKKENGRKTDKISTHASVAEPMELFLREWEEQHPKVKPVPLKKAVSEEEKQQLRSLGYLR